jgi:hypothetical protein
MLKSILTPSADQRAIRAASQLRDESHNVRLRALHELKTEQDAGLDLINIVKVPDVLSILSTPVYGGGESGKIRARQRRHEVKLACSLLAQLPSEKLEKHAPAMEQFFERVPTHGSQFTSFPYSFVVSAALELIGRLPRAAKAKCAPTVVTHCLNETGPDVQFISDGAAGDDLEQARATAVALRLRALRLLEHLEPDELAPLVPALLRRLEPGCRGHAVDMRMMITLTSVQEGVVTLRAAILRLLRRGIVWTKAQQGQALPLVVLCLSDAAAEVSAAAAELLSSIPPSSLLPHVAALVQGGGAAWPVLRRLHAAAPAAISAHVAPLLRKLEHKDDAERRGALWLLERVPVEALVHFEAELAAMQTSPHAEAREFAEVSLQLLFAPPEVLCTASDGEHGGGGPLFLAAQGAFQGILRQLSDAVGGSAQDAEQQASHFSCPACGVALCAPLLRDESVTTVQCECGAVFGVAPPPMLRSRSVLEAAYDANIWPGT